MAFRYLPEMQKSLGDSVNIALYDRKEPEVNGPAKNVISYEMEALDGYVSMKYNLVSDVSILFLYDSLYRLAVQGVCLNTPANCNSARVIYSGSGGICDSGYLRQMVLSSPLRVPGLLTGSVTSSTCGELLYNTFYYNSKGLSVDVRRSYPNKKLLFTRTDYTFTDKPKTVTYELRSADHTDSVTVANSYSISNDALLSTDVSCNGSTPCRVSSMEYDLLGRPSVTTLPGNAGAVSYAYNVRGWLTGISGTGYDEDIFYDSGNGRPLYNGSISSVMWRDGTHTASRGYMFTYDDMNRLTDAVYGEGPSLSDNTDRYSECGIAYTKNGSITRLLRYGMQNTDSFGLIDSLALSLDGNRILSVYDGAGSLVYDNSFDFKGIDTADAYEYDGNGNLILDPNKRLVFEYDLMGNPKTVFRNYITEYIYSSSGEKLGVTCRFNGCMIKPPVFWEDLDDLELDTISIRKDYDSLSRSSIMDSWVEAQNPRNTSFCGPFVFERGVLDKFLFDGGYVTFSGVSPAYHFYRHDHLGNVRAVISEDGTVEQTTEYYPFGGIYGDVSTNPGLQPYKYNGKEFDHFSGLDLYDYGAHMYDPALIVWTGVDPLAEKYPEVSPYVYCGDNPVSRIDPDGMDWYQDKDKTWQYSPDVHSQKDLAKGQVYKGRSFSTGKGSNLVQYRSDGSILYTNETAAYNRMWNQADVHYRKMGEKGGREVGGFILSNGKVLVLPDYKNNESTAKIVEYGYLVNNRTMKHGNEKFSVMGQIHTHQSKNGDPSPSFYTSTGYGDLGLSALNSKLPVFTIGCDGKLHGIYGEWPKGNPSPELTRLKLSNRDASLYNLLNGKTRISSIIRRIGK